MSNNSQFQHLTAIEWLWNFLFPQNSLKFSKKQLDFLAFGRNYRYYWRSKDKSKKSEILEENSEFITQQKYRTYYVPKSDWKYRIIREPCDILKQIQKWILQKILLPYSEWIFSDNCTGFRNWFSIVDNAKHHTSKEVIIKLDISDFFPSISQARVYGFSRKNLGLNHQLSSYISWLCSYKNELPQWAPTSPMIANLIGVHIDNRILKLIEKLNQWNENLKLTYSRYADDMTFSYDDEALNPNKFINYIQTIIEWEWFLLNLRKIRLFRRHQKQEVTWIIVNNTWLSIWRKKYKLFRAIVHSIKEKWWEWALEKWNFVHKKKSQKITDIEKFKQVMKWYHDYIFMVSKEWSHIKYLEELRSIF